MSPQTLSSKWLRWADFVRLLDEQGQVSLTNLAMWVVLVKMALVASFSLSEAAILLPVIGSYSIKRYFQRRHRQSKDQATVTLASEAQAQLATLVAEVERLKLRNALGSR